MRDFIFLWSERNDEHVGEHDVTIAEAEFVVEHAQPPYPENIGDDKRLVWGQTDEHRLLQIIFVHVFIEEVETDEFERLELFERLALDAGEPAVRIIHARDLTEGEKKQLRRRRRGRP